MRSFVLSLVAVCLAVSTGSAQVDRAAVTARVQATVKGYAALLEELDINRLPVTLTDYREVIDRVDELGAALESLTRLAGQPELTEEQWRTLDERSASCASDLQQVRKLSLPLRVWSYNDSHGNAKPEWGLAIDRTLLPQARAKHAADGEATLELTLQAHPGESCRAQILVVPLSKDLRGVQVTRKGLGGRGGVIKPEQIECAPLDYDRVPEQAPAAGEEWWREALLKTRPDIARDLTHAFILTVAVPAEMKQGRYEGRLFFSPANSKALALKLIVEVAAAAAL